jgi:hypothetical protein
MNGNAAGRSCIACLTTLLLLSLACSSQINEKNYLKIDTGMTQEEVGKILGEPTESSGVDIGGFSGTTSVWKSEEGTISITFLNKKVAMKEFSKVEN